MKFVFNGEPLGQPRPRFARRGNFVVAYDKKEIKQYKENIGLMAAARMQEASLKPFTGPLLVRVVFYRHIQKSISNVEHKRRASGISLPVVKYDIDNLVKAVLDACNKNVWVDDNAITDLVAQKRYSENPRIEMEVLPITKQK